MEEIYGQHLQHKCGLENNLACTDAHRADTSRSLDKVTQHVRVEKLSASTSSR